MRRILLQIRMARIKKDTSPQDPCHPLQFQSATGLSDQRLCIISNESPVHSAINERSTPAFFMLRALRRVAKRSPSALPFVSASSTAYSIVAFQSRQIFRFSSYVARSLGDKAFTFATSSKRRKYASFSLNGDISNRFHILQYINCFFQRSLALTGDHTANVIKTSIKEVTLRVINTTELLLPFTQQKPNQLKNNPL